MADHIDLPAASSPEAIAHLNRGLAALQDALRTPGLEQVVARQEPLPEALLDALDRWLEAYDAYIEVVSRQLTIRCGRGCSACCAHGPNGIGGVEALLALRAARRLPDGAEVLERMAAQAERFGARVEQAGDVAGAAQLTSQDPDPCSFLGESGQCRIYAHRPVACRMFMSLTNPEWCDHRHPNHHLAINPHLLPAPILRRILSALSERLGVLDLPSDLWRSVTAAAERWTPVDPGLVDSDPSESRP